MGTVNFTCLVGRLGKDPETKFSAAGKAICKFSIATDDGWEQNKKTNWHSVVAFGKTAEICGQYLSKGSEVYVRGSLDYNKIEKDGSTRYYTNILASEVKFLGSKSDNATQGSAQAGPEPVVEDDLPF